MAGYRLVFGPDHRLLWILRGAGSGFVLRTVAGRCNKGELRRRKYSITQVLYQPIISFVSQIFFT